MGRYVWQGVWDSICVLMVKWVFCVNLVDEDWELFPLIAHDKGEQTKVYIEDLLVVGIGP